MADKDRTRQTATEMNFNDFHAWATGYVLLQLGEGISLRRSLHVVIDQAAKNTVFGGVKTRDAENDE